MPSIPVGAGGALRLYFAPSVFGLVGFWSSKSQSKDVSPVHVAGEG